MHVRKRAPECVLCALAGLDNLSRIYKGNCHARACFSRNKDSGLTVADAANRAYFFCLTFLLSPPSSSPLSSVCTPSYASLSSSVVCLSLSLCSAVTVNRGHCLLSFISQSSPAAGFQTAIFSILPSFLPPSLFPKKTTETIACKCGLLIQ